MPNFEDLYFPSSTEVNRIRARKCLPAGEPRAVIQIAHGIAEHIERYDEFMAFLADNGFVAVGDDHLGHGKSITSPEEQGFFAEQDGWQRVLDDMAMLQRIMRRDYGSLPYIFFGHSMGSFLTRCFLIQHPEDYDAAILSGTGQLAPALVLAGGTAASLLTSLRGPHGDGRLLNDLAFGAYTKRIDHPRTAFDWLSRDPAVVDRYINDPLCGFVAQTSLYRDMMGGIRFMSRQRNIDKMDKLSPVYFMSGAEDPVGDYGAGVERAYQAFCKAGLRDVSIRLYPGGRHEMLNETNKEQVYQDILSWLNEKLDKC